uniref:Uncharacterized protein n=1 Tax=Anopheles dirus TaxID=7168 RepID=A0A182NWB9_9DIPT
MEKGSEETSARSECACPTDSRRYVCCSEALNLFAQIHQPRRLRHLHLMDMQRQCLACIVRVSFPLFKIQGGGAIVFLSVPLILRSGEFLCFFCCCCCVWLCFSCEMDGPWKSPLNERCCWVMKVARVFA